MPPIELRFESEVAVSPVEAWGWISSVKSIQAEMWPYFRMTAPRGIESIGDLDVEPGKTLFLSRIIDHLTFEPRWIKGVTGWFINTVFKHRHKVIRRHLK